MRISDWSSDVCSSDLLPNGYGRRRSVPVSRTARSFLASRSERRSFQELQCDDAPLSRRRRSCRRVQESQRGGCSGRSAVPSALPHPSPLPHVPLASCPANGRGEVKPHRHPLTPIQKTHQPPPPP